MKTLSHLTDCASSADYKRALALRSRVHVVLGNYDSAILDSQRCGDVDSMHSIESKRRDFDRATVAILTQNFPGAYELSTSLLKESPESLQLLLLRARAGLALGFYSSARSDAMNALRISRFEPEAILILSRSIFSDLGNVTLAHINTKFCRIVAPDYEPCGIFLRIFETLRKDLESAKREYDLGDFHSSVESCKRVLTYPHVKIPRALRRRVKYELCRAYGEAAIQNVTSVAPFDVLEACEDALSELNVGSSSSSDSTEITPDDAPITVECRIRIAWAWIFQHQNIGKAKYEILHAEAISRQHPTSVDANMRRLHSEVSDRILYEEEELKKKEEMESDLYGLLGLLRNATLAQIKKAYRTLAYMWHPDRHMSNSSETDLLDAEKMFVLISQAYEILSDPAKRKLYDDGLDPEQHSFSSNRQGGGGGGNTFTMERDDMDPDSTWQSAWSKGRISFFSRLSYPLHTHTQTLQILQVDVEQKYEYVQRTKMVKNRWIVRENIFVFQNVFVPNPDHSQEFKLRM